MKYAGVPLHQLYKNNEYSNPKEEQVFITFKAGMIKLASNDIELTSNDTGITIGQSMFTYLFEPESVDERKWIETYKTSESTNEEKKSAKVVDQKKNKEIALKRRKFYSIFDGFDNDKKYGWIEAPHLSYGEEANQFDNINNSILTLLKKNYDENVVSDLITYYLKESVLVRQKFFKNVLNFKGSDAQLESMRITREKENRIDIFCETPDHVFVIENKIKADFTFSEIKKEDRLFLRKTKEFKNVEINKANFCQLSKYYIHINSKDAYTSKTKHFYIFVPDYSDINGEKKRYIFGDIYKEVKYSIIHDFFKSNSELTTGMAYISEFLAILALQKEKDILLFEQKRRAKKAIDDYKASCE